ncbi:hypothetical protein [Tardisphaera miroshnichenkoae]
MGRKELEVLAVVNYYLSLAERNAEKPVSREYARKALLLCDRFNVQRPYYLRRQVCPKCGSVLVPSVTSRVRVKHGRIVTTCLSCGYHVSRSYPRVKKVEAGIRTGPQRTPARQLCRYCV